MSDPIFLVAATLLGAVIGSYLNVLIYRLPRSGEESFGARSACPACGHQIPWNLNLPVLSWILLRGKARCCGARISIRYPFVEALTASLFFLLAWYPPSGIPMTVLELSSAAILVFVLHGFFVANLVANTGIDWDHRILPDVLTKSLMLVGVLGALFVPELVDRLESLPARVPAAVVGLIASLWGLLVGMGL
ncbi:MAG: prepilin peptidase, partial [Planctomycetota bacterium]